MTREFEVGDKVFDVGAGNGVVESKTESCVYVRFENDESNTYNPNGKYFNSDLYPTLFHGHDLIIEVKEPEYEWQVLYCDKDNWFDTSVGYFKSLEDFRQTRPSAKNPTLIEPSKRLVKEANHELY